MNKDRWQALMAMFGIRDTSPTYGMLIAAYSEKHRHYHTARHINDCLDKLDAVKDFACHPDEIEIALWFHDAVYDPYKSENEEKSATWACEFLASYGIAPERVSRVREHILATKHEAIETNADSRLLVDIDLSILGADENEYATFENNVREEYKWVPSFVFKKKRAEILKSFVDRPTIYSTEYFRDHFEVQARRNLQHAIAALV